MRAAIYARYSSENQNERSIEDQARLCRDFIEKRGGTIVEIFADYAISGSSLRNRPEANRLLESARAGLFDTVVAEALDRLSRDQEDVAGIFKRLRFASVALITVSEGEVNELHVGLKGTMNALFVRDLAAKVRRGQRGRIENGRSAGGLSYGYDVVRELDAGGELVRGKRAINAAEAAIVLRIFREFVSGRSPRAIAAALNRDGVPSPAGRQWNASTINGHRARGNGILYNPLYVGSLVYNRLRMEKDPDTGRRVSRVNPRDAWVIVEAPELRIVPQDQWDAAQAHKRAYERVAPLKQVRPKHLFSGLLRCSVCGGAYVMKGNGYLGCSRHRESGTCNNCRTVRLSEIERRVLDGLKTKLLAPSVLREALVAYHDERRRLRDAEHGRRREIARRLPALNREIERLVDAIVEGISTKASNARLMELEAEKERLSAELAGLESTDRVVDLHPGAIEAYTHAVENLQATLAAGRERAADTVVLLRRLISRIDVVPGEERAPFELKVHGRLAELTDLADPKRARNKSTAVAVAGEGFEPPTLGL